LWICQIYYSVDNLSEQTVIGRNTGEGYLGQKFRGNLSE